MGNSDHGTTYMREGGDDGELRPWHYIYVYSIGSRLVRRVRYDSHIRNLVRYAERSVAVRRVPRGRIVPRVLPRLKRELFSVVQVYRRALICECGLRLGVWC